MVPWRFAVLTGIVSAALFAASFPAGALGADSVFWTNDEPNAVSVANLDGSGGRDLSTAGATLDFPFGVALDPDAGRIYWPSFAAGFIAFANLDGSGGGGDLEIDDTQATRNVATGIAIDPVAKRIYWTNLVGKGFLAPGPISFAKLDGSGAKDMTIAGATVDHPQGIAVDHGTGRIYWANRNGKISLANLDGGEAGDIITTGATAGVASSIAVDPAAGLVYWTNLTQNKISFAHLDGSGGGDLTITGAPVHLPKGIAIDHAAGRIYWANSEPNSIAFARLDGGGGGEVKTGAATMANPASPVLFLTPRPTVMPAITGTAHSGSSLSCSQGEWAGDIPVSFLYQAAKSFSFQWTLDGKDIPGATQSSVAVRAPGDYRCRVTAQNRIGSTAQATAPVHVPASAFGKSTGVTLTLLTRRVAAGAPIKVRIANSNGFSVKGKLAVQTIKKVAGRLGKLKAKRLILAPSARRTIKLKLSTAMQQELAAKRKLALRLTATVTDLDGHRRVIKKTVTPKLRSR